MATRTNSELPELELVARETMAGRVYAQLREAIMTGRFAPGQLLSLRSVAEAVGSSTMPVRAALTRLQAEGALIDGPGRALMVPPMTPELLEELRDVRVALEGAVARRAASRMTREHLDALQNVFDTMDAHVEAGDVPAYLRSNFEFHIAIYTHGASDITLATIQNLWMRIGPFLNLVAPDIPHMRRSMAAHRHIVEALWRGDGEGARAGIEEDISDAAADLHERLRSAVQGNEVGNEQARA
ncbi:GntR family transcriptional regulator [Burkholderia sp. Ac-20365]|uniref:GntR family transcriptional regulator n=1 Tax=Burkholderia sp. Ac-20365 TaxID=2703897 RepID=UPI00197CAF52|nr:GntR family transcriptional regulator [Burkholderia sp. Ac-20365]MBN3763679.1 GntR family transcriptional regulator [Burkholderia sp. Ac-20365]